MTPNERLPRDWYEWAAQQQVAIDKKSGRTLEEWRAEFIKQDRARKMRLTGGHYANKVIKDDLSSQDESYKNEARRKDWSAIWFGSLFIFGSLMLILIASSRTVAYLLGMALGSLVGYVFFSFLGLMDDLRREKKGKY